jgi:ribosomal protein S18 acetylase RimI-like enzyme
VTVVRPAEPDDWAVVREIRLRALAESPSAFASTLAREEAFGEEDWRRRLQHGYCFLAQAGGRTVGTVAGFAEEDVPDEHHLVAMWVEPAHRGTPAATELVEAVCRRAREDGAAAVRLWVVDGNERARRLYERLGFVSTGERQPLPSAPEISEELLRRDLGTA